jgi:hypothetical protein
MWESGGITQDLERCDRQHVHEALFLLSKGANLRFIVASLAREAVAAQALYETI